MANRNENAQSSATQCNRIAEVTGKAAASATLALIAHLKERQGRSKFLIGSQ